MAHQTPIQEHCRMCNHAGNLAALPHTPRSIGRKVCGNGKPPYPQQNLPTRLQKRRKDARLTQKELADRSGVKLRTIQQYEMRARNINKVAAETLLQLAQVLLCNMEDLIEYDC